MHPFAPGVHRPAVDCLNQSGDRIRIGNVPVAVVHAISSSAMYARVVRRNARRWLSHDTIVVLSAQGYGSVSLLAGFWSDSFQTVNVDKTETYS